MRAPIERPSLLWRGFVIGGIGTLKLLSFSDTAWEWWEENVTDALPRSTVRQILAGTVVLHAAEAALVNRSARRAGLEHVGSYTFTTMLYGFPEIRRVRRAIRAAASEG